MHIHPVETVYVIQPPAPTPPIKPPVWNVREPEVERETIPPDAEKSSQRVPETIPNNSQTIPNRAQNEPELIDAPEPENALNMPEIEDEGDVGRKRKNEDTGIYGDISVKDIILFRYIKKRHWPDLSGDMKAWYEHFYFKRPTRGEKPYRGRDYEQHKRAYERGQEWIAEHNASTAGAQAVGHSGSAPYSVSETGKSLMLSTPRLSSSRHGANRTAFR